MLGHEQNYGTSDGSKATTPSGPAMRIYAARSNNCTTSVSSARASGLARLKRTNTSFIVSCMRVFGIWSARVALEATLTSRKRFETCLAAPKTKLERIFSSHHFQARGCPTAFCVQQSYCTRDARVETKGRKPTNIVVTRGEIVLSIVRQRVRNFDAGANGRDQRVIQLLPVAFGKRPQRSCQIECSSLAWLVPQKVPGSSP